MRAPEDVTGRRRPVSGQFLLIKPITGRGADRIAARAGLLRWRERTACDLADEFEESLIPGVGLTQVVYHGAGL